MQLECTVYPNATLEVDGSANGTTTIANSQPHPPPGSVESIVSELVNYAPMVNASVGLSTSGNSTSGSANGTIVLPKTSPYSDFPFNCTTADFTYRYNDDMLDTQLDATVQMPPAVSTTYPFNSSDFSLLGTYANGLLNVGLHGETTLPSSLGSQFPFNITDLTVLMDFGKNEIRGNVTFHAISGFPLGDVTVYFSGNKNELSFTGLVTVIYGDYFGMTINETTLESMLVQINSTIPGQGPGSLYEMTNRTIECTELITRMTPITVPLKGASVDYEVTVSGNFTELIATYVTSMFGYPSSQIQLMRAALEATLSSVDKGSLMINYFHASRMASIDLTLGYDVKNLWSSALQLIPPTVPPEYRAQYEALIRIYNDTAYAIKDVHFNATYSNAQQKLELHISLTEDTSLLRDEDAVDLIDTMSDSTISPQLKELFKKYNATYYTLDSLNATVRYVRGTIDFDAEWLISGDLALGLNSIKKFYIEYLNLTMPYMITWQTRMLDVTEMDIGNFKAEIRQGEDWQTLTFEGLRMQPIKEETDSTKFKFYKWLNMTSEMPPIVDQAKVVLHGGHNGTHAVILSAPSSVPTPNMISNDSRTMIWESVTMSALKDVIFQIAQQGVATHIGVTYYFPIVTNSTVSDFDFDSEAKSINLTVTGASGSGFCNITIPRSLLDANLAEWKVILDHHELTAGEYYITQNAEYVFIYLSYTHSEHRIEVIGTWVNPVPEFSPDVLPVALVLSALVATMVAMKQRKRLSLKRMKDPNTG